MGQIVESRLDPAKSVTKDALEHPSISALIAEQIPGKRASLMSSIERSLIEPLSVVRLLPIVTKEYWWVYGGNMRPR